MIELKTQIVVCNDFEELIDFFKENIDIEYLHIIDKDEFKIEDAKEAIKEAYIATNKEKYIILAANRYNIYSQNSLLKILEEPPSNINFIILTKSKSSLLPTIRSRLPITILKKEKNSSYNIDVKNIDLNFIYNFLKNEDLDKEKAKEVIKAILKSLNERGYILKEKEIDLFANSIKLLELNANLKNVLTTLFLTVLDIKKR